MISTRVKKVIDKPSMIVKAASECGKQPFDSNTKEGYLNFGVAENFLVSDLIQSKIENFTLNDISSHHYNYTYGLEELRLSYCQFLNKNFADHSFNPENIIVAGGATSILELLSYSLFDEDDTIIVPSPYYLGFDHDFSLRFKVKLAALSFNDTEFFLDSLAKIKPKAILLTNPSNPDGKILPSDIIDKVITYCVNHQIHVLVDEVYALTILDETKFTSVLEKFYDNEYVHHIYSMAKDFALSGFKVGYLHTTNNELINAARAISYFYTPSTMVQHFCKDVLNDQNWIDTYKLENKMRINQALSLVINKLPTEIHYKKPQGAFFLYMNLKKLASKNQINNDEDFFLFLLNKYKINMLPGKYFHDEEKFNFRCCFARSNVEIEELCLRLCLI